VNYEETGLVLAKLAAFDQRTVGESDLLAWHEVLGRYDLDDCLAAVTAHYADTRDRAMPADIRRHATRIRNDRHEREERETRRLEIEAKPDRSDAVTALVQSVVDALPKPDVHQRALARARKDRGRPEPVRHERKKPAKPGDYPVPASDDVAALATRYLLDGHEPRAVAERLAVSRRWCEKTIRRLRPDPEGATA